MAGDGCIAGRGEGVCGKFPVPTPALTGSGFGVVGNANLSAEMAPPEKNMTMSDRCGGRKANSADYKGSAWFRADAALVTDNQGALKFNRHG